MPRSSFPPTRPLVLPPRSESEAIAKDVLRRLTSKQAFVSVSHSLYASAQYTRNEVRTVSGGKSTYISVTVDFGGRIGGGGTDRLDEAGLSEFIANLEDATQQKRDAGNPMRLIPSATFTDPPIYFNSSAEAGDPEWQGDLMRKLARKALDADLIGAADVGVSASARLLMNTAGLNAYSKETSADVSMTARTKSGKGSGWCWDGGNDMAPVNFDHVANYAMDIAKRSDNPQAVEPGRYTVILEPEAVAQLVSPIISWPTQFMSARAADMGYTVYSKKGGGNKRGLQMMDRLARLITDPMDSLVPYSPLGGDGSVTQMMEWFEKGILRNLHYDEEYAREMNEKANFGPGNGRLYFEGPSTSYEDMVKSTQRGLWIHRFSGGGIFNMRTLNMSGVTRDGTFLIENGKITKPVKNLRYMESPFFMLNKVDAWGDPVRTQGRFAAPRIKAHDFEFIALSEAV